MVQKGFNISYGLDSHSLIFSLIANYYLNIEFDACWALKLSRLRTPRGFTCSTLHNTKSETERYGFNMLFITSRSTVRRETMKSQLGDGYLIPIIKFIGRFDLLQELLGLGYRRAVFLNWKFSDAVDTVTSRCVGRDFFFINFSKYIIKGSRYNIPSSNL